MQILYILFIDKNKIVRTSLLKYFIKRDETNKTLKRIITFYLI